MGKGAKMNIVVSKAPDRFMSINYKLSTKALELILMCPM